MKRIRVFRFALAFTLAIGLLAGLYVFVAQARAGQAAPAEYTPHVEVVAPAAGDLITRTPQVVTMTYNCSGTLCLGTLLLDVVSVTVDGGQTYTEASLHMTDTLEKDGVYIYEWRLPSEDYVSHTIISRARDAYTRTGVSSPVTVHVDTVAPTLWLTLLLTYTENVTFPVAWRVEDGSGEVSYTLAYQRDDDLTQWTAWPSGTGYLTQTGEMSDTFTVTQQTIDEGHTYHFRLRAYDKGNNMSEVTESIRVGKRRVYLPLVLRNYPPPPPMWQQGSGSAGKTFRTPKGCGASMWYAGTSGTDSVWRSMDNAESWTQIPGLQPEAYPIVANPGNCAQAFVSVWGEGVYRLDDEVSTLITENLAEPYVYGLTLKDNFLYAGTSNLGIYRTGLQSVNWQSVNDGIDMEDQRIRSLFNIDGTLYAGARACSLYVLSESDVWGKQTIPVPQCDDAQVWSIARVGSTLYAGLGGDKGLYYQKDAVWRKAPAPIPGDKTIWGIVYNGVGVLYISAYEAGVYRCEVDDSGLIKAETCERYDESRGLTTQAVRELYIHNDLLVAGSDNGVWYLPISP